MIQKNISSNFIIVTFSCCLLSLIVSMNQIYRLKRLNSELIYNIEDKDHQLDFYYYSFFHEPPLNNGARTSLICYSKQHFNKSYALIISPPVCTSCLNEVFTYYNLLSDKSILITDSIGRLAISSWYRFNKNKIDTIIISNIKCETDFTLVKIKNQHVSFLALPYKKEVGILSRFTELN